MVKKKNLGHVVVPRVLLKQVKRLLWNAKRFFLITFGVDQSELEK